MKNICPDEQQLGDYIEGLLDENGTRLIEAHLSDCDVCRQELLIGNGLVRGGGQGLSPVPERVTKSALGLINEIIPDKQASLSVKIKRSLNNIYSKIVDYMGPIPWFRWGFAPVRGKTQVITEDLIHVRKEFKGVSAEIDIEKIEKNNTTIRVRLFKDKEGNNGIRITLQKNDREVSSILTDSRGYALFDRITYGHYSLIFIKDGMILGEYLFETREYNNGRR